MKKIWQKTSLAPGWTQLTVKPDCEFGVLAAFPSGAQLVAVVGPTQYEVQVWDARWLSVVVLDRGPVHGAKAGKAMVGLFAAFKLRDVAKAAEG